MKYFKNVKSFEDLKNQFKKLARANHPDAGGNADTMKEINCEYDALFPIWKDRHNTAEPNNQTAETAESTRRRFYTEWGWEGCRYDSRLTTKDIAARVRVYVKEKYPTCKFSVRASGASRLTVDLKEFPEKMYKTGDDLRKEGLSEIVKTTDRITGESFEYSQYKEEVEEMDRKLRRNGLFEMDSWTDEDLIQAYEKAVERSRFYAIKTEYFTSVIDDVEDFVKSYNYDDSDSMIDYFDTNFYFFGVGVDDCKQVEKTARIKNKATKPEKAENTTSEQEKALEIENKASYTYKITKGEDTQDSSELWVVRIAETLDKSAYIEENKRMKERGGYYSKFKKGFIFRFDPAKKLTA